MYFDAIELFPDVDLTNDEVVNTVFGVANDGDRYYGLRQCIGSDMLNAI
jgi:hypothetical protein